MLQFKIHQLKRYISGKRSVPTHGAGVRSKPNQIDRHVKLPSTTRTLRWRTKCKR